MTADTQDLPPAGARRAHGNLRAIAIMCLASLCFIAMHSFIKSVRGDVPVAVILWSQYAFQAAILTVLFARRLPLMVSSHMLGLQILRALLLLATVGAMFVAVGLMQLADAIAIGFVAPLLITALSVVFLKERVGLAHWLAILVGFAGMLVIIRPGAGVFDPAALVPLAAAVFAACYQTLTRPIARSVEPSRMLYMATLTGLAASSVALPFFWQTPTVVQLAFLLAAACLGAASHFLLIKAYQGAPASVVAPFSYSELIWAAALGFAVFGDVPEATTVVGGMVLAASGLYLLRRGRAESTG
jgi:drug/metabolite transporter (DMT)-like permease